MAILWKEPTKFRRLPINANPVGPTKTAIAFDVNIPAIILVSTEVACNEVTFIKTLSFI